MARLPSYQFLMQQVGSEVILFEDYTEREIVRFDPSKSPMVAWALEEIQASELGDEDKTFACFWAGYFHAYAGPDAAMASDPRVAEADGLVSVFLADGTEVVRFDPSDQDATARAQKSIYDCALIPAEKARAHFWCGFLYAQAAGQ